MSLILRAEGEQWAAVGTVEIILEGFVFSLTLPTVLLNYSAGVHTVSLSPLRAAGRETHFFMKAMQLFSVERSQEKWLLAWEQRLCLMDSFIHTVSQKHITSPRLVSEFTDVAH